jgi:TolA-binding protein
MLLSACSSAPEAAQTAAPADSEKEALQAEVDALSGKVEQLQDKVDTLQKENQSLQDDSTVSAAEDLAYLMDVISNSGQTLTSFPAIVTGITASGEGFMLTISRLDESGTTNSEAIPEDVYAGPFTYAYYDSYLMPELDEGFADYIAGFESGAQFTVYMLGDQVVFLNEIVVS